MSDPKLDFSVRNVPDSWHHAASEAPQSEGGGSEPRQHGGRLPTGTRPDLVTGTLTGTAMSVIFGAAWWSFEMTRIFTAAWLPVLLSVLFGTLIAVAVRLGAGPAGPEMRIGIGAALYIFTVLAVAFFVSRQRFVRLNRRSPSFGRVEELMTAEYLNNVWTVSGWILGFGVMCWTTFALRYKRRS